MAEEGITGRVEASASSSSSSSRGKDGRSKADKAVIKELQDLYENRLLKIETDSFFHKFHSPQMLPSELGSKPMVLLLGQYSVGKTTFIRHLIKSDYPGMHVGPEPTTDRFIACVYGSEAKIIKGNAATGVSDIPSTHFQL
jgi:N-terminal EH-domain containing protein